MLRPSLLVALPLALLALAATQPLAQAPLGVQAEPRMGAHGLMLPGTFTGDLPAPGGPGIRATLDLWPDQVFQLRRLLPGSGATEDRIGRWHVDPGRSALVLEGAEAEFAILGNGTLRLLDREGRPVEAGVPHTLARADAFAPFEPRTTLRGMFLYFADAARFTDCASGRSWPVAMEGDFLALQRAYIAARPEPQPGAIPAALMARIEARVAERPRMEGAGSIPTVVVERFLALSPGETCDRPAPTATLRNTYWRLLTLAADAIRPEEGRREPHLLLMAEEPRFSATVGCNQMLGGFETDGTTLRFHAVASTMMACPAPLDARERTLAETLALTASFRLDGTALALLAADGRTLATFEAVYLR